MRLNDFLCGQKTRNLNPVFIYGWRCYLSSLHTKTATDSSAEYCMLETRHLLREGNARLIGINIVKHVSSRGINTLRLVSEKAHRDTIIKNPAYLDLLLAVLEVGWLLQQWLPFSFDRWKVETLSGMGHFVSWDRCHKCGDVGRDGRFVCVAPVVTASLVSVSLVTCDLSPCQWTVMFPL